MIRTKITGFTLRHATNVDVSLILDFIRRLAEYEKLAETVTATEEAIRDTLFGERIYAEAIIGEYNEKPVAFAIFFHNYSTFLAKPGIYLEDLFVLPEYRGKGFGRAMLSYLAKIALKRDCGRLEWSVLNWNEPALNFYKSLGAIQMNEWITERLSGEDLLKLSEKL